MKLQVLQVTSEAVRRFRRRTPNSLTVSFMSHNQRLARQPQGDESRRSLISHGRPRPPPHLPPSKDMHELENSKLPRSVNLTVKVFLCASCDNLVSFPGRAPASHPVHAGTYVIAVEYSPFPFY